VSPGFQLQLKEDRHTAGDTVKGTILITEGGRSRSLEARLEFVEETDDYLEVPISISSGQLHAGDLTRGMSFEFALPLPPNALPSYASEHGELYWRIDAKSNELGNDTHEIRRIEVERGS
jgi:hypothetical protein